MTTNAHPLHSQPGRDEQILAEALAPERRYESITLAPTRHGYPGDLALFFKFTGANGTNIVNLRPGDLPLARAALIPEDPALKDITGEAVVALGPGARSYVQQAHARGYGAGVRDMELVHDTMAEAERVRDWLDGFYESAVGGDEQSAVKTVIEMIARRLENEQETSL